MVNFVNFYVEYSFPHFTNAKSIKIDQERVIIKKKVVRFYGSRCILQLADQTTGRSGDVGEDDLAERGYSS